MSESVIDAPLPPSGCDHYSKSVDPEVWWRAHFVDAAGAIVDFFAGDGISLEGKRIADVGCGDGIIDLGVAVRAKPEQLVGFDILDNDVDLLQRRAAEHAGIETLPPNLYFSTSETTRLPAEDDSFDYVISWSAFEHIDDPVVVLREVRRILRPMGVLFIQLWPFYDSAHGTHLVDWFPEGFAQYRYDNAEILRRVRSTGSQDMASEMLEVYRTLNGITADGLQDALRQAGFRIVKVALDSEAVHIPVEAAHLPLSRVAISGIKLLAIAQDDDEAGASAASDGAGPVGTESDGAESDGAGPAGTASEGTAMDGAVEGAARPQVGRTGADSDEAEGGELAV